MNATDPAEPAPETPRPRGAARSFGRWLFRTATLAAVVAGLYWGYARLGENTSAAGKGAGLGKGGGRAIPVVVAAVRRADLALHLDSLGAVTAFNTVTIRSRVDGELVEVAFAEGQKVREGDVLARIDPRPYEVQLAQAQGLLDKDEAQLKNARLELTRDDRMLASKTIADADYSAAAALVRQFEGTVAADRAAVDNAKLQLSFCRIVSPLTGRIGLRRIDKGNFIRAADPAGLAVVAQTQPIAVVFTVPQDDAARVQRRQAEEPLRVQAFGRDLGSELASGAVTALDNQVDPASGTVRVKATFENRDDSLFPNQFVNIRMQIETRRGAVVVPAAAVQHGPDADFAYVVKADDTVELRPVAAGPTEGDTTAVNTGLEPGETVVTQGFDKLQPGSKVEVRAGGAKKPDAVAGGKAPAAPGAGKPRGRKQAP